MNYWILCSVSAFHQAGQGPQQDEPCLLISLCVPNAVCSHLFLKTLHFGGILTIKRSQNSEKKILNFKMVYLQIWEGKGVWGAWKPCFWLTLTCFAVRFTAKNGRYNCVSKYSTGWWLVTPYICGCWLEMDLLRPKYTKLDPFFAKGLSISLPSYGRKKQWYNELVPPLTTTPPTQHPYVHYKV